MSLDRDAVRRVIDLLKQSGAAELELAEDGRSVRVMRRDGEPILPAAPVQPAEARPEQPGPPPAAEPPAESPEPEQTFILARMVGLFHRGQRPDAEPLVEVGDSVKQGQVVATIEALRKLTEVRSSVDGTIAELLVEDGEPVQYGQKLFAVEVPREQG